MSAVKEHLMSWATGRAGRFPRGRESALTVVLENPEHLSALLASGVVDARTMVFVPGHAGGADGPVVVGYEGSLSEPGAEFSHDPGFYLQIQAYGISEYMSVVGPTLIRVADGTDFEIYLRDADRARHEGVFAEFLTNPVIQLADLPALGAGPQGDGPVLRLHVGRSGELSTSSGGRRLGTVGDSLNHVAAEWARVNSESAQPCAVCLGGSLPEPTRASEVAERPWLGRYLAALHGIRDLRARGLNITGVSGFGGRLVPALSELPNATDAVAPTLPLLLWTDDSVYVHSAPHGRSFQLDRVVAEMAEALLVCGSVDAATAFADRENLEQVRALFDRAGIQLDSRALSAARTS
ncbi:daptide biosynthesis RiPP recognition protein [Streptomyces rochei]|uniref:daptide biosynthesis RiPP recognition protein n=1 Tax=Streptomyces TaxID=1883 RepID=UPI00294A3B32|nr:daptide biosynthesis RiPP recognition protein [Streptomyces sp. UP1A-1]